MKIVWTEPAVADLESIRDYIARDSGFYALQFAGRLVEAVETLESFPERGRKVPESLKADDAEASENCCFRATELCTA
jgi:plasmid stabilization system protein ParE